MFVLKNLSKYLLGNKDQDEILILEGGKLLSDNSLVYEDASLILARAKDHYSYNLIVSSKSSKKLTFPLPIKDFAKTLDANRSVSFTWLGSSESDNSLSSYCFVLPPLLSASTVDMFHMTMAQCIWETINKKQHEQAKDEDLKPLLQIKITEQHQEKDNVGFASECPGECLYDSTLNPVDSFPTLYFYDSASGHFVPHALNPVNVAIYLDAAPKSTKQSISSQSKAWLILKHGGIVVHCQPINPDATQHTDRPSCSFVWCYISENGILWTFSLKWNSQVPLLAMANAYGQAVYQLLNEEQLGKQAKGDRDYLMQPFLYDVEMTDATISGDSNSAVIVDKDAEEDISESDEDSDDLDLSQSFLHPRIPVKTSAKNEHLVVSYTNPDRSFVTRGKQLAVYKTSPGKGGKKSSESPAASLVSEHTLEYEGRAFSPQSKMMLYDSDSSMLLKDPSRPNYVYRMDLDRGVVVDEWRVSEHAPVTALVPDSRYAQMTGQATFIGLNQNSIFRIDPRQPGDKRVDEESKQYVVKNKFSCGATSGAGGLAVASEKGELRLFNALDKRAKTLLPLFGDPILGVDVTDSGRYIICTCKSYLLLIDTAINSDPSTLGFNKPMGQNKPIPKRLAIKPEHVALMGIQPSFTPARFTTGTAEEKAITTSTGPFVITWPLAKVLSGHLYSYQIKRYSEPVIADSFRYGADSAIVVTLPHDVTMVSGKGALKPASPRTLIDRGTILRQSTRRQP